MGAGASVDQESFQNHKSSCEKKAEDAEKNIVSIEKISFYPWDKVEDLSIKMQDAMSTFASARADLEKASAEKENKLNKFKVPAYEVSLNWYEIQQTDKSRYDQKLQQLQSLDREVELETSRLNDLQGNLTQIQFVVSESTDIKQSVDQGELNKLEEKVMQYKAKVEEREKRVAALKESLKAKEDMYNAAMKEFSIEEIKSPSLLGAAYCAEMICGMGCNRYAGHQAMAVPADIPSLLAKLLENGTRMVELELEVAQKKVKVLQDCEQLMTSFPAIVQKVKELRQSYDEAEKKDKALIEDEKPLTRRTVYLDSMLEAYNAVKAAPQQ